MLRKSVASLVFAVLMLIPSLVHTAGLTIGSGSEIDLTSATLNVSGDIANTGTLTVGSGSVALTGNWSNSGTFTSGTGTVTFNGTNQSISGTTTFYNLTKNVTSAATLTFQNGSANKTTITNTLDLQGASGQLLSLRSDTAGSQWEFDPQGTRTIQYLDVKDSNNVSATNINAVGQNCTDSENNTKWSFTQLTSGTYYVNIASGNDSNSGSSANPWKTFHYSVDRINNAAAGTYILIMAAGTYSIDNGEADTEITLSQSNVTIVGADDHTIGANNTTTTIDGTSATAWTKSVEVTGSSVIIKGVSITNFSDDGGGSGIEISGGTGNKVLNCKVFSNDTGIKIDTSSAFKVRFCEIYSNANDGLYVESSTDGEIYRNTIYLHQGSADNGVYVVNCSPAIKRNKIYDNDAGIRVKASGGGTASPDIRNNVIYENTDYVMNYGILVRSLNGTASPTIYHNSIDGGTGDGIALEWVSTSTLAPAIKFNIITRCDEVGIDANTGATCAPDYNDVWGNTENYDGTICTAGTNDISQDPQNGTAGPLPSNSPCVDAILTNVGDNTTMDYLGYKRPKGSGYDMGAYEYIAQQTYSDTLPGGSGAVTDYDIFTIPLDIGTGANMQSTMEGTLGTYDRTKWRVFSYTTNGDVEMTTQTFDDILIKPGLGLWGITVLTDTISFTGTLAPDAIYYDIELDPGWHLFAVPWKDTDINLGRIYVTDGVNQYTITDGSNTLTLQKIWDYTSNGYVERTATDFSLGDGVGFYIKVLGTKNVILSIPPNNSSDPPNNSSVSTSHAISYGFPESVRLPDDSETPPLPTGSYGPMPDIKANGKKGASNRL